MNGNFGDFARNSDIAIGLILEASSNSLCCMLRTTALILICLFASNASFGVLSIDGSLADTFESIGTVDSSGEDSITFQMIWTRASGDQRSASFEIASGLASTTFSAAVPNNQSATDPQDGTFNLYDYTGGVLGSQLWTIGDSLVTLQSGQYAMRWYVPAKGMGGASSGYGNASFAISTESVPDSDSTAALLVVGVVALAFARRRLG